MSRQTHTDHTPSAVTAGAALLAGVLLLWRTAEDTLLIYMLFAVGLLSIALIVLSAIKWNRLPALTGPDGYAAALARPLAWLAGVFAVFVVALVLLPPLFGLSEDGLLAIGLILFLVIALLGWAPMAARAWPSKLSLSPLTVVGSLVAIALIAVYLYFLVGMRDQAATPELTDATWARLVELRSTLEALAFAAAGALLGQTVGRQAAGQQVGALTQDKQALVETIDVAVDKLTGSGVTPASVTPSNAAEVDLPENVNGAIREALSALTIGRDQVRGNPLPTDF